jgi:hypothetical protein
MNAGYLCPHCNPDKSYDPRRARPTCPYCKNRTDRPCPACQCDGCRLAREYEGEPLYADAFRPTPVYLDLDLVERHPELLPDSTSSRNEALIEKWLDTGVWG